MTVFLVSVTYTNGDVVYGVATTKERAIEIAHSVQERGDDKNGHLVVALVEADKYLPEGA